MIVTIDGPAGAGKSTAARRLAERLGFDFLDTGAMYRVVTLTAIRAGVASTDEPRLARLLEGLTILVEQGRAFANGEEVTSDIRTPEVTSAVRHFADKGVVRRHLVAQQQRHPHHGFHAKLHQMCPCNWRERVDIVGPVHHRFFFVDMPAQ